MLEFRRQDSKNCVKLGCVCENMFRPVQMLRGTVDCQQFYHHIFKTVNQFVDSPFTAVI